MNKHFTITAPRTTKGFVLISVLVTTVFVMLAGVATAQLASSNYRSAVVERYRLGAQLAADAGLDSAMQEINIDSTWPGVGETTLQDTGAIKTTYETVVTNDSDPLKKYVTTTGRTYSPSTSATPRIERTYQISLRGVASGNYSIVTGVGGLNMLNNSLIIGGNVFVNGEIYMSNSSRIGLPFINPVDVRVAHQACPFPADSTYPRVCNSGEKGEPIHISGSGRIYGEVIATNQTDGSRMSWPGLVPGNVNPSPLPTHDRAGLVSSISSTVAGNVASCSSGSRTWAANTKITGDVTISGSCRVTIQGDVWVTGKLTVSNIARLIVGSGITTPPVIMIDGSGGLDAKNAALFVSNSSRIGFRVITYWSEAACSPDCSNVTGADLYDSRDHTTISLRNTASGINTEFYARWSKVSVSNGGSIGALVGQTVEMSNSAAVTFGATVSGAGGVEGWVIDSYKRNQ